MSTLRMPQPEFLFISSAPVVMVHTESDIRDRLAEMSGSDDEYDELAEGEQGRRSRETGDPVSTGRDDGCFML